MGYKTEVQLIKWLKSEQYYVNIPAAVAQAIEFSAGEEVEWLIDDHQNLVLRRSDAGVAALKEKLKMKSTHNQIIAQKLFSTNYPNNQLTH